MVKSFAAREIAAAVSGKVARADGYRSALSPALPDLIVNQRARFSNAGGNPAELRNFLMRAAMLKWKRR
jgi:hypothetical protein